MEAPESIVEVVYALPRQQILLRCRLEEGMTLLDAVVRSGLLQQHPELKLQSLRLGVFGALRDPAAKVAAGDRIEVYRPLLADPKDVRRARVQAAVRRRPQR